MLFREMTQDEFFSFARGYEFRGFYMTEPCIEGLWYYLVHKRPTGSFLEAVLCNDLKGAVGKADDFNIRNIPAYVAFLYNHAPSDCWGSRDKYLKWINQKL